MTAYSPHQLHTLFRELGSSYMLLVYMRNYPQPVAQGWLSRVSGHSLKTIREKLKVLHERGLIEPAARYQWLLTPTAHEVLDLRWSPEAETPVLAPAPKMSDLDEYPARQVSELRSAHKISDLNPAGKNDDLHPAHKISDLNPAGKNDDLHPAHKISDLNPAGKNDDLNKHSALADDRKVHLASKLGDRMDHPASELGDQKERLFPAGDRKEHLISAGDHTEHTYTQRIPNLSTPSADQNVHLSPAGDRFDQLNSIFHLNSDQSFKKLNELKDLKILNTTTTTTIHESIDRSSSILNDLAQNFENEPLLEPNLISTDVSPRSSLDDDELVTFLSN
jgi:predicted transcriptional regulator